MIVRRAVPDDDHVSRYVPNNRQHRDDDTGEFLGLTLAGFKLRPDDEGGLSVTWIERFGPFGPQAKRLAATAYRESQASKKLGKTALFAYARVAEIKAAADDYGKGVRVVTDPVDGNEGHAQVRHFTDDDLRLLELLATEVFGDVDFIADMNLPSR